MVASISFGEGRTVLLESNFESGSREPWKVRRGSWPVEGGKLVCSSHGNNITIYAKLEQSEPTTFVAKLKSTSGYNMQFYLGLFADTSDGFVGRNSVYAMFNGSQCYLGFCRNGGSNNSTNLNFNRSVQAGTFRFAYNPKTGKGRAWLDSTDLGEHAMGYKPKEGKYVVFMSYYSLEISELTVLRGIVPPAGGAAEGEEKVDIVEFENRDRISATAITMADGELAITTSFGELKSDAAKVGRIIFRTSTREKPRRLKGDVQVQLQGGRMTMALKSFDAEHIVGTSPCYGDVKLRRSGVRGIRFNVYR
jgi:hypothetical protein